MKKKLPPKPPVVSLEDLRQLGAAVRTLQTLNIESVGEARVFAAALEGDDGKTIGEIVKSTGMPFSTVSRVAWALEQRNLVSYGAHATDRRKKIVRANVQAIA